MEAKRMLTCAALAWAAGYAGIGALRTEAPGWHALVSRWQRRALRFVRAVGTRRGVSFILRAESVIAVCDEWVRWFASKGLMLTREDCGGALVVCVLLSIAACMLSSRSIVGMFAPVIGWCVAIPVWDSSRRRKRTQALSAEMPGVFRTLAMAMSSGETLAQAISYVGEHGGGLAGGAFRNAALKLRCGISSQDALGELVDELNAPGIDLLATALLISQRTGSPLRTLFQHAASLVERQGEFERMLSVKTAQVRLSVRIVSLLPLVMVGTLSLISPDFQHGLMTVPGMTSLFVAAAMDLLALGIIRHLMKGVL